MVCRRKKKEHSREYEIRFERLERQETMKKNAIKIYAVTHTPDVQWATWNHQFFFFFACSPVSKSLMCVTTWPQKQKNTLHCGRERDNHSFGGGPSARIIWQSWIKSNFSFARLDTHSQLEYTLKCENFLRWARRRRDYCYGPTNQPSFRPIYYGNLNL